MARSAKQIINRLDKKLFQNKFVTRQIVINKFFVEKNELNEEYKNFDVQDVITGVVLEYKNYAPKYDIAGEYEGSQFILIIPISYEITKYDEVILGYKNYVVAGITQIPIGEINVSQKIFLVEDSKDIDPDRPIIV